MASKSSHSRKPSSRAALPRRTTRGPLDAPDIDPLAVSETSLTSSHQSSLSTPQKETIEPSPPAATVPPSQEQTAQEFEERDLSFLLDPSIYHALSQVEVPAPFRKPFLAPPNLGTPIHVSLTTLDTLLAQCDFVQAAHFAATVLLSGNVPATDSKTIFRLLETRYSCLELCGNLLMAAQEAKELADLTSEFYYDEPTSETRLGDEEAETQARKPPVHIMPFSLRLQVLRLQSIGFSDPRRGVSSLYDVAMECREHLSAPTTTVEQRRMWSDRLDEISTRVVNALIDTGDLEVASRTLQSLKPTNNEQNALWTSRMVLLKIKMGDMMGAETMIQFSGVGAQDKPILESLFALTQGRLDNAITLVSENLTSQTSATEALLKQNLAVAYLYRGEILQARTLLEELVDSGHSFQTLTVNLATIFDLTSDRSRDLKMSMASRVAKNQQDQSHTRAFANTDFKL